MKNIKSYFVFSNHIFSNTYSLFKMCPSPLFHTAGNVAELLQESKTRVADPAVRRAPDSETGHLQHLAGHRKLFEFFGRHAAAECRHVHFVQQGTAKRHRRHFFRGDLQLAQ